ncbi:transcription initiation factor IIB [Halorientalis litorea]|jgi:transcription initiation factor TFIIB|uniref:transcription initiation factor IIB n=1 Tax=Halorientalis litorea TaxID=2931977 RepID=UPI001FF4F8B7|nr:transcription initiation factor IIB family protein [Halorientalis litorea]
MAASTQQCPECAGQVRTEDSETVCADCGLVVTADHIDHGPEWRSFEGEQSTRERTGAPLTRSRHDRGLSTDIGHSSRLKGRKRRQVARMRRQHNRAQISSKRERNQVYGFGEIRRLVSALDLPDDIRERACVLFESAQSADLLRGRSLEGFAAAAVYAVCRTADLSRTLTEVVGPARADRDELKCAYDALNRDLGLPTGPIDPAEYVPRFASELDLSQAVERRAAELVQVAHDRGVVTGRDPAGVAAGCLYTAAREADRDLTQAAAAAVAGVTPVTLRGTYQELNEE